MNFDFDVLERDGVAVVLQEDRAFGNFAEVVQLAPLAGCDVLAEFLGAALVFDDFRTVEPVLKDLEKELQKENVL